MKTPYEDSSDWSDGGVDANDGVCLEIMDFETLWLEAELLGKVDIETCMFSSQKEKGRIKATVTFERKSGTRVCAAGYADNPKNALQLALKEAISLNG